MPLAVCDWGDVHAMCSPVVAEERCMAPPLVLI